MFLRFTMKNAYESNRLLKTIPLKWVLALTILGVVLLGNYLFVSFQIDQMRTRDRFLTLANRQAMLLQRCGVFFWMILKTTYVPDRIPLHQELVELVIHSEENFTDLKGMNRTGMPEWTRIPPETRQFIEDYLGHLRDFVATPTRQLPQYISNPTVAFIGKALEKGRSIPSLSEWVESCTRKNEEHVIRFHQWMFWLLMLDFALLAGIGMFIFHPMNRHIAGQFQSLNRSRTILALAQRIAHIGSWEIDLNSINDLDSNPLRWSDETYRIFGYEPDEVPVTSALFWEAVHPDDREKVSLAVKEAIRSFRVYEIEHRIRRKDGGERIVLEHADIQWESGVPVRLVGTVQDITKEKTAEQELIALKNKLARDLEAMNRLHELNTRLISVEHFPVLLEKILDDVILLQSADFGTIQLYDDKAAALTFVAQRGFKEGFLKYFNSIKIPASACALAVKRRERVLIEDVEKDDYYAPTRPLAAEAGFRAVHSIPMFILDGKIIGVISTYFRHPHRIPEHTLRLTDLFIHHVSELIQRKQAEEALRKSEEEFRAMFELSIVGQAQMDSLSLQFFRVNKKFCEMIG